MENETKFFLEISGLINTGKHREFQQTVKFVFNHLSSDCIRHNLALDVETPNLYHIYCLWQSQDALIAFTSSNEFQLLKGAFKTLGEYQQNISGKETETHLFEINHRNSKL